MQAAASRGGVDQIAAQYRDFVLRHLSLNQETRRPYIFYNTWNFQERNKWFNGKPYLSSMNPLRILAEIEVAHRMGIDVFVLDTGWYEKTGDWEVSQARFPNKLADVKNRLDRYGMKLGLWFDPTPPQHDHRRCFSRIANAFVLEMVRKAIRIPSGRQKKAIQCAL